jgi:DMSO reductase anchor subunit
MGLSTGLLAMGLLASMLHLGQPLRGGLALRGVGRSPLSNEVVVTGVAVLLSAVAVFLPAGHAWYGVLALLALVAFAFTLVSLGMVYRLRGQLTWLGLAWVHPLVMGVAFGCAFSLGSLGEGVRARAELLVLLLLAGDALLVWERTWRLERALRRGAPVRPSLMRWRVPGLTLRVLLGVLLPALAVVLGRPDLAVVSLAVNLVLDRVLFYALAVQANTEGEVMRVEAVLRGDSG